MSYVYDDGGRAAAGYKGEAEDCVARAIAIAGCLDYRVVYDRINRIAKDERTVRGRIGFLSATGRGSSARTGIFKPTTRAIIFDLLDWAWTPTMRIGSGCTVHLRAEELPTGRLIVSVSRHVVAVIDGVIHDTHDPSRDGTRCVYGY